MNPSEQFHARAYLEPAGETLRRLQVEPGRGISKAESIRRRKKYGPNTIASEEHFRLLKIFFHRFRDILVLILLAAGAVSLFLGHAGDAIIIAIAILIDVSLSFVQVWRTEKTLEKMKQRIADTTMVVRDGTVITIPSSELVIGDIIELHAGDNVPADARIISSEGLQVQEAILTGESGDVPKHTHRLLSKTAVSSRANMVFAGTTIVSGNGRAVVTGVGRSTEFGKIAQVIKEQKSPDSPLRRKLQRKGLQAGWLIIGAVALLTLIEVLQGDALAQAARTGVTLIVSAIPEDLTMILTISLTVGVARILRRGGVVRRLSSGETLGGATVICTDKTGTLTEGKMEATELIFMQGDSIRPPGIPKEPFQRLALIGLALTGDAHRAGKDSTTYVGSATERTALAFVEQTGFEQTDLQKQWKERDNIPFNGQWKYQAKLFDHPTQSTRLIFVAGAPDVLLARSSHALNERYEEVEIDDERRNQLNHKIESLAGEGQRLLAIAVKRHLTQPEITHDSVNDLTFLAVLTIEDPIREGIMKAITDTISAGVDVKLVTGDHAATARAIASQAGLSSSAHSTVSGTEFQQMSDSELSARIDSINIFARVEPLDKQRIIRILQEKGHVVAMTGDGVNDAVALKGADIGVAMGSGTDIAKDASDLILLDNSLATIVAAIQEGRVVRDNVRKVVGFLLATNTAEVAIFFVSVLTGLPLPLLPAQILWINLVTDGTSDIALALEPAEEDVMKRSPEDPELDLIGPDLLKHIGFSGIIMTIGTMGLFWYLLKISFVELSYARTMAFTFLSVASLLSVWSFRSLRYTIWQRGLWQNKWIPVSAGFSFALHILAVYVPAFQRFFNTVPLHIRDWVVIVTLAIITVVLIDLRKLFLRQVRYAR